MSLLAALALAAAPAVSSASAGIVSSYDPPSLVRLLQAEGYKAKLTKDRDNDPMIESGAGGSRFFILFYGCRQHSRCTDLQFNSAYDTDGSRPSLEIVNKWNAENRWGRAYLDDENDPVFEMDVMFADGTLSTANFGEQLNAFTRSMGDFEKAIGWNGAASPARASETTAR